MNPRALQDRLQAFASEHGISLRRASDLYAARQLLVRLQKSQFAGRFQLKGGMFIGAVLEDFLRTTRDADVLGEGDPSPERMKKDFTAITAVSLDDGVQFGEIRTRRAEHDRDGYDGVEVTITALVAELPSKAKVDVGFGDAVVPPGGKVAVPPLFAGGDDLVMPAYSVEAFLAEKTETLISAFPGKILIRLKDFHDIYTLTRRWMHPLEGPVVLRAFEATFERRKTAPDRQIKFKGLFTITPDMRKMSVQAPGQERKLVDRLFLTIKPTRRFRKEMNTWSFESPDYQDCCEQYARTFGSSLAGLG